MSETSSEQPQEYQYPDEFKDAMAILLANIPRIASKVQSYQIQLAKDESTEMMQIGFIVPKEIDDRDDNIAAVSRFLDFIKTVGMPGLSYHEETTQITFANAGVLAQFIERYIDENPDRLDEADIEEIESLLETAVKQNAAELVGNTESRSPVMQSRHPISAIAFIDGIMTIKAKFPYGEDLSSYYMENPDNGMISMMIACENMEGEDFVDPDHIDALAEIESVIGGYNAAIAV